MSNINLSCEKWKMIRIWPDKVCIQDVNIAAYDITDLDTHVKGSKQKNIYPKLVLSHFCNKTDEESALAKRPETSCE